MTERHYEVLVHDGVRRHRAQRLPDGSPIVSSPLASTLIFGDHDAVLVDGAVYPRAGGAGQRLDRALRQAADPYLRDPRARRSLVRHRPADAALPGAHCVCHGGHDQADAPTGHPGPGRAVGHRFSRPDPRQPGALSTDPAEGFQLEGYRLVAVETGHTDTDDTTVLHVPVIGLVVAGDVAYNGVHQYLLESAEAEFRRGSRRSTRSPRCHHARWPAIRTKTCPTIRPSSTRPATTCSTRNGCSPTNPVRGSSTTR